MKKVLKSLFSVVLAMIMVFGLSFAAFAVDQNPIATVNLGVYDISSNTTWYSNFCRATLSSMTLHINSNSGDVNWTVQRRTSPTGSWSNMGSSSFLLSGNSSFASFSTTIGYDYRIKVVSPILGGGAEGQVSCD